MAIPERSKWWAPPTRPMKWNEANPLADSLVSLLYVVKGEWFEAGPYGGNILTTRVSGTSLAYQVNDQTHGKYRDAIQYATIGSTAGDGFRFIYPRVLTTTSDNLTIFSMGYTGTSAVGPLCEALYANTGGATFVARTAWGDGTTALRMVQFQHAASLLSSCRSPGAYSTNTPSFVSGTKSPSTATAPRGYASGALMSTTTNQNAAWINTIQEVWIGRGAAGGAGNQLNGGCMVFGLFTRLFTDAEQLELYDNPWQLIRPSKARVYAFGKPAASTFTTPLVGEGGLIGSARGLVA